MSTIIPVLSEADLEKYDLNNIPERPPAIQKTIFPKFPLPSDAKKKPLGVNHPPLSSAKEKVAQQKVSAKIKGGAIKYLEQQKLAAAASLEGRVAPLGLTQSRTEKK